MKEPGSGEDESSKGHGASTDYVGPKGGRGKKDLTTGRVKYTTA